MKQNSTHSAQEITGSDQHGSDHGTVGSYLKGFILAAILTLIPFYLVMDGGYSPTVVLYTVVGMAVIQILVHLIYFLHMNTSSDNEWNLLAMLFTALIIGIVVIGSLWIMHHLNHNMMPM